MELTFKKADESDWKEMSSLGESTKSRTYVPVIGLDEVKKLLKESVVFLIQENNKTIGMVSYEMKGRSSAYLRELTVQPSHRSKGVGAKTMEFVMNELKSVKHIDLLTPEQFESD